MIDRVAFEILGLKVYWYGIVYAIGFLIGYYFINYYSKNLKISEDQKENIFFLVYDKFFNWR